MDTKPSFPERIAALKAAAETVMAEAQRMDAAARKFGARRQQKASRYPGRAQSTKNRQVWTPVIAILRSAGDKRRFNRPPTQKRIRLRFIWPADVCGSPEIAPLTFGHSCYLCASQDLSRARPYILGANGSISTIATFESQRAWMAKRGSFGCTPSS
jgi:hypothetical protein